MRKVKLKANKYINQGREKEGEAFFHCFGVLYEEIGETAGNFTVAIVEDEEGMIWNVHPEDLQFLDPPEEETHIQGSHEENVKIDWKPFHPDLYRLELQNLPEQNQEKMIRVDVVNDILNSENTLTSHGAFAAIKTLKTIIREI